ncbi:hypothetical protein LEP1GSC173_0551 [Leptospira interrogans str. HAI1594]|uniref:Uncharacterized protein n=12 Tax=Leptospira interrogans TaxID=173 RepID=A0A0E2D0Q1_LEPIR|nr:hypothetical protein G436_1376 [Leptospira interrogans serovar Hardjo str. Norma]EJO80170.1 hypothetical protein LEP1GSC045_4419 [Leptospira interrogans serovar Pomona str. Kennewicki LC82-25]EJP05368.1 hypothetical protein LEP1GSC007_1180 [Leptospira interrogans serovar Bulgarica str. Mallika]EJP17015.1 hypothetical protein LEP1GSC080_2532 [Leptospira interrogans str. FPW2026]EKN96826.1 hypothetical protein LEP1GSC014_1181 [Leptospira interrogans serovar Pomona str. Pomona]EKO05504.1 hypot
MKFFCKSGLASRFLLFRASSVSENLQFNFENVRTLTN